MTEQNYPSQEQIDALKEMIQRRMENTNETQEEATEHILAYLTQHR